MNKIQKITFSGLLVAIGVLTSNTLFIPIGPIKAFPIQHAINVLSAVLMGPFYALLNAFSVSIIRNLLGTGTLLAFPGSMIGAFLAAMSYKHFRSYHFAALGECLGTGLLGSAVATYIATTIMESTKGFELFFTLFTASSLLGSLIGWTLLKSLHPFLQTQRKTL